MGLIEENTKKLIQSILDSEDYKEFCKIRDEVKKDPELRQKINDFRLHVFQTQNSRDSFDMYEEQQRLGREYEEFRKNPLVSDFLKMELRVCRILQQVTLEISNGVDLDAHEIAERIEI